MVDRERDLGREVAVPAQRRHETKTEGETDASVPPSISLSDEQLHALLPRGSYTFERKPLEVVGRGIKEVGIRTTRERVEAYELSSDGKSRALKYVLTGYRGIFGTAENDKELIRMDIVGTVAGDEMTTEIITAMPSLDLYQLAQAVARRRTPIAIAKDKETDKVIGLLSRTPAGLLTDLTNLENALRWRPFASRKRRTLTRAKAVAQHIRDNLKVERPSNQPGRIKVKGQ